MNFEKYLLCDIGGLGMIENIDKLIKYSVI